MIKKLKDKYLNTYVKFQSFKNNQKGQGMVEYGIIIGVIALIAIAAFSTLGNTINNAIADLNTQFNP